MTVRFTFPAFPQLLFFLTRVASLSLFHLVILVIRVWAIYERRGTTLCLLILGLFVTTVPMFVLGLRWLMTVDVSNDYGGLHTKFRTSSYLSSSPIPHLRLFSHVYRYPSILGDVSFHTSKSSSLKRDVVPNCFTGLQQYAPSSFEGSSLLMCFTFRHTLFDDTVEVARPL